MSLLALTVPREYGYVVGVTAFTCFVGVWHGFRVAAFRKPAKIIYPKAWADNTDLANATSGEQKKAMYLFNCAQRAHINFNENHPSVMATMLLSGIVYPQTSAALGAIWSFGRIMYAFGYTSPTAENGKGRVVGFGVAFFPMIGLFGLAAWTAAKMVL
ncbi:related to MICROSOMAL GLUTATHIONE S-TRANSFERASE 3 [Ramularia collo-cygni]|uniref:Related to MICROSOMAL GLUTATHIONE S-TRANSFERASE 3 n=1 Tax=Ramularia collo-cygni TaxID=112498 RepID=A0A2D3VNN8_9PEZI|nr:related to MICROSOMAL GLUTATHIONE S-TRANSFERASE 3 [Ramularia collo-cygni]CZT25694.1 related to MICROSOMAL GLUTATHIONE S-TRANSFERASE 3 [Ramularia collo-cygni]